MFSFDFLNNLDLLSVAVSVAAIGVLGFSVFFNDRHSATNRTFLFFSLVTIFWGVVNYAHYQFSSPVAALWLIRLIMFFAVWQAFALYRLFIVFPEKRYEFGSGYKKFILPAVIFTSFLTLTPFVFSKIVGEIVPGSSPGAEAEPGIFIFAAVSVGLVAAGIYVLIKKTLASSGSQKPQFFYVLLGAGIMFGLIIILNFVFPVFFDNQRFLPLGALFILPFAGFTAYSIFKHRLLDIRVIATELMVFALAVVSFAEVIFAVSPELLIFRASVFLLVLSLGILLVRSVVKEIKQKEELERLSKELESANAELKKLDQLKSDFLSFATHQLRTPLTVTKGYVSMILEGSYGDAAEAVREKLQRVYDSNERLIKLVDDFLNLSRIEQGRMKYDFARASVDEIAGQVASELEETAKKKGLELTWKRPVPPLQQIIMDASKIHEVIYNLADNAIKYTKSGSVKIKTERSGAFLRVSVSDTGVGISDEDKSRLFERFSRAPDGYKINTQGHGIGLYVARHIVEAHGGKIWAESPGLGQGSTFNVELPIK